VSLYTGTGDKGETGLADGTRVSKIEARIEACGDVDELNAMLGIALASGLDSDVQEVLSEIQSDLFALGTHLADPRNDLNTRVPKANLDTNSVKKLEEWIDDFDGQLPPLRKFLLPGGGIQGASLHAARAVCRRAERRILALGVDQVPSVVLQYINRVSDLLFALARAVNFRHDFQELEW